ncbi:DNA translocase FtsK [Chryseobacterium indologenes]|uniref:DNA translocase FtsK n=1 Tax=Chryseobacterium indologenes TaxID=253 RepID=UPI001624D13E|nr:DNA translocase FtsK [Chryseobacterium indologenes]
MSIYKTYTPEQLEELHSNFIIKSWSYSKVAQFSRNEKGFEMIYVYGYQTKKSASTLAGNAYHEALSQYFKSLKAGEVLSLPQLEIIAFEYIDSIEANKWKLQKTTPTIAEAKTKAIKTTNALLKNFYGEKDIYEDHIRQVLDVEVKYTDYLTINGVDIPIPCTAVVDLVFESHEGKIIIVDHKSKNAFSSEEELSLSIGKQAMTYVKSYEAFSGLVVDEVWFCENKYSQNQKALAQLNMFRVVLDPDTRRLYEAILYEPLKRMIEAVHDPDYVYLINDSDNLIDRAELYEFWAKTLIAEVDEFDIDETETNKDLVEKRLRKIRDSSTKSITPKIIKQFKKNAASFIKYDLNTTDMEPQQKIEHILKTFGIQTQVAHSFDGYSSNTFLVEVAPGTKILSIQGHKLDIASALNVTNVRIPMNLSVYEDRSYLSIEHSKKRTRDLFFDPEELIGSKIPIGKDNMNNTLYWDIDNPATPHLLVGGSTGSGKSAFLISTLSYLKQAGVRDFYILDPKYEFEGFGDKYTHVFNDMGDIEGTLLGLVDLMDHKIRTKNNDKIVIVFDEFAAAIEEAGKKSTIEVSLKRITQKGRSCGMRVITATQRASVKTISGDIKVNFPVVVCFRMNKEVDSKVMLDEPGAETLAGFGDGLFKSPSYPETLRFQSFFIPEEATA